MSECQRGEETPSALPYLTDMENSPGALSLSRTRKAPHSRCLSRLSATLRDIRPANQLDEEEEERMRSSVAHAGSIANPYPIRPEQTRRREGKNRAGPKAKIGSSEELFLRQHRSQNTGRQLSAAKHQYGNFALFFNPPSVCRGSWNERPCLPEPECRGGSVRGGI